MLTNTFIHIQSIGIKTEQKLWDLGIKDWNTPSDHLPIPIPAGRKYFLKKGIEKSKHNLDQYNPVYFSKRLPSNQSWRIFPEFRDSTAYLDIETTGLDHHYNSITTIALYDGQAIKTCVQSQNWRISLMIFANTR